MSTEKEWQELINKYGVEGAWQVLLNEFHKRESLQQPSPNIYIPTKASDRTDYLSPDLLERE